MYHFFAPCISYKWFSFSSDLPQKQRNKDIARVRNCPEVTKLSFCSLSFCLFFLFFLSFFCIFCIFCPFVFSNFFVFFFVFWSFCLFVFFLFVSLYFCLFSFFCIFIRHHSDQMSEASQVSKVTLCVEILKWHSPTE